MVIYLKTDIIKITACILHIKKKPSLNMTMVICDPNSSVVMSKALKLDGMCLNPVGRQSFIGISGIVCWSRFSCKLPLITEQLNISYAKHEISPLILLQVICLTNMRSCDPYCE